MGEEEGAASTRQMAAGAMRNTFVRETLDEAISTELRNKAMYDATKRSSGSFAYVCGVAHFSKTMDSFKVFLDFYANLFINTIEI